MSDVPDLTAPATRGDLIELETSLEAKLYAKLDERDIRMFTFVKDVVEDAVKRMTAFVLAQTSALEQRMTELVTGSERRLMTELGRHTRASAEDLRDEIAAVDDKYADLPDRVKRLEDKVGD